MHRKLVFPTLVLLVAGALIALSPAPVDAKPPAVDVPGADPYLTDISVIVPTTFNTSDAFSADAIPADKRLVIEFISVSVYVPTGQKPTFAIDGSVGGRSRLFLIPLTLAAAWGARDEYRATQLVRLYVDGDGVNGPKASCGRDLALVGPAECDVTMSGYLISK